MIKVLLTVSETFPNIEDILSGSTLVVTKVPNDIPKEQISYDLEELNGQIADDSQYDNNFKTLLKYMKNQMPFELFHLPNQEDVSV